MTTTTLPRADEAAGRAAGIGMTLAAFAMFTAMDTAVKLLGSAQHVVQVVWLNSLFALAAVAAIGLARGGRQRLRPRHWRLHGLRWAVSYVAMLAIFSSFPRLPIADVYAILFAAPLLITALSIPLLGERVGWRRWVAVAVGFLGVLVVLAPGDGMVAGPALIAFAGTVAYALSMVLVRKIGLRVEPVEAIGVAGNGLTLLLTAPLLPLVWVPPTWPQLALAASAGTVSGTAFLLLAGAHRLAPASTLAPFQYSQMVYGLLVGWLLFADQPSARTLAGSAVIVASGLYLLHRERHRGIAA